MFLRRIVEALRVQNWTAIAIEFAIVVFGVFLGTQVANWNQDRAERRETERMLLQLVPELAANIEFFDSAKTYYAVTRRFADQALAAWKGDRGVSDEQFVIAAYQASQIYGISINAENWTITFGGEQLRNIDDPRVRRNLELVLTQSYDAVGFDSVATPIASRFGGSSRSKSRTAFAKNAGTVRSLARSSGRSPSCRPLAQ